MLLRETLFHSDLALEDWQLMACVQPSIVTGSPAGLVLCKALETTMPPLEKSEASSRCDQFAQASKFFGQSEQDVKRQCSWSKTPLPAGILLFFVKGERLMWKGITDIDSSKFWPLPVLTRAGSSRSDQQTTNFPQQARLSQIRSKPVISSPTSCSKITSVARKWLRTASAVITE